MASGVCVAPVPLWRVGVGSNSCVAVWSQRDAVGSLWRDVWVGANHKICFYLAAHGFALLRDMSILAEECLCWWCFSANSVIAGLAYRKNMHYAVSSGFTCRVCRVVGLACDASLRREL